MARTPVYRFRITGEGLAETKAALEALGPAGEAAFEKLKQSSPQLANALDKARASASQTRRELETLGQSGTGVANDLALGFGKLRGALGVLGIGLGVRELVQFTIEGNRAVAQLDDLAQQFGITAQQLQLYRFAAIQTHVDQERLDAGLAKFTLRIGEAAEGGKAAIEMFERLNVKILDAEGNLRPHNDILLDTADGLSDVAEQARRAAIEVDLFGKSGQKLDGLFGQGSAKINDLFALGTAANIGPTEEQVRIAKEAEKAVNNLAFAWENLTNNLAVETAPVLIATVTHLEGVLQGTLTAVDEINRIGQGPAHGALSGETGLFFSLNAQLENAIEGFHELHEASRTPLRIELALDDLDAALREVEAFYARIEALGAVERRVVGPDVIGSVPYVDAPSLEATKKTTVGAANPVPSDTLDDVARRARDATQALAALNQAGSALDGIIEKFGALNLTRETKSWLDLGDATERYRSQILQLEIAIDAGELVGDDLIDARQELAETTDRLAAAEAARVPALEAMRQAAKEEIDALSDRAAEIEFNNQVLRLEIVGTEEARDAIAALTRERALEVIEMERTVALGDKLEQIRALEADGAEKNAAAIAVLREEMERINSGFDRLIGATGVNEALTAGKAEMERRREEMLEPYRNFLEGVQATFTDFWGDVYSGNIDSWSDAFDSIKQLAIRFAAELTSLLTIQPVIDWALQGLGGILGSGSTAGIPGARGPDFVPGAGGGALGGGLGDLFGLGNIFNGGSGGGGVFGFANNIVNSIFGTNFATGPTLASLGAGAPPVGSPTAASFLGMGNFGNGLLGGGLSLVTSLLSGQDIGPSLISAGLTGVGTAIGGPIGGMIGGLLGSVVGSLFGSTAPPTSRTGVYSENGLLTLGASDTDDGGSVDQTRQLAGQAVGAFNELLKELGGSIDLPGVTGDRGIEAKTFGFRVKGDQEKITSYVYGDAVQFTKDQAEEAMADFIIRLFKEGSARGDISGLSETLTTVLENTVATTIEDFAADVDFASLYDSLTADPEKITLAEQAIKALTDQFVSLRDNAERLGLALAPVDEAFDRERRKLTEDFDRATADAILGFENPFALAMQELQRFQEAQREEAIALGADLVQLEKLHAMQREQAVSDFLESSLSNIQDFIDGALLGSLSTLSPEQKLFEARRRFNETSASAIAGDPTALRDFAGVGQDYLSIARDFFASSQPYAGIFDTVLGTARQLGDASTASFEAVMSGAGLTPPNFTYPTYTLPNNDIGRAQIEQSDRHHDETVAELRGMRRELGELKTEFRLQQSGRR